MPKAATKSAAEASPAAPRGRPDSDDGPRRSARSRSRERGANGADVGMAGGGAGTWGADDAKMLDAVDATATAAGAASDDESDDGHDYLAASLPKFAHLTAEAQRASSGRSQSEYRRVRVPAHRYTPLRQQWEALMAPIVEHLKLLIRFNPKARAVELKTGPGTLDTGALQKARGGAGFLPNDAF
jgi:hypothetical protein